VILEVKMKANELRIGNYVYDNLGGVLKIKGISLDSTLSHIKPIPLTEEWLVKLEFIEHMDKNVFIHPSLRYSDKFKLREDGVIVFVSSEVYISDCKYVHQLQNLYFALSGKELKCSEVTDGRK